MSKSEFDGAPDHLRVPDTNLPFDLYVQEAIAANQLWSDNRGFTRGWASGMWRFAQIIKAHPHVEGLTPIEVADEIEEILRTLTDEEDPWHIFPTDTSGLKDSSFAEFITLFTKVRRLPGIGDPLSSAEELARRRPLDIPFCSGRPGREALARFLSIAGYLQYILGCEQLIALPVERLAAILGVSPRQVTYYRNVGLQIGLLKLVKEHRWTGRKGAGRATQYRFDLSAYPHLSSVQSTEPQEDKS